VQVWDHNADGTITFNLLYSFEKDDRIFHKEFFEEQYIPFDKDMVIQKMMEMGYAHIRIRPVPCEKDETDFSKIDWYRVIGQKPE
jgi:hypothetical protein